MLLETKGKEVLFVVENLAKLYLAVVQKAKFIKRILGKVLKV